MQPRYTAEQWATYYPALRSLAVGTVEMARSVLVDGKRPIDVANECGESRQLIHAAVKRVRSILEDRQAQGLVPVLVWLPPALAEQVKEMAEPYEKSSTGHAGDTKKTVNGQKEV